MNAAGFPLLTLLTFLPLVGAAFILTLRGEEEVVASNARWTALWTSLIVFALSPILWFRFDKAAAGFQFVDQTVHVGGRVPVVQRHVVAVGMQPAGDRGADATGGAGDEDDTTRRGHGRLRNRSPHSPCFAPEWRKTAPKNVSRSSRRREA